MTRETYASERVRAATASLVLAACVPLAVVGVSELPDRGGAFVILVTTLLLVAGLRRASRLRVEADGEGLTVVNLFRTHRVRWDEVERFERRRPFWAGGQVLCPVAVTANSKVALVAMPVAVRQRGKTRALKDAAVLERWESRV